MATTPDQPNSDPGSFPRRPAAAPKAVDSEAGEVTQDAALLLFSRYRIERELGRGGMGRVMLAYDTKLHLHVALKLVPDQLVPDTEAVNDLRQEVHRGMALMHPAILRTHTLELDEGGAAIVMEYVDGCTLAELKEQQQGRCFDPAQILPWLESLCAVLDYAHRDARIVHRDLKPRNLMQTRDGRLKVADFGIAATLSDTLTRQTGEQFASGTPAFMSPQQARGKKPSHLDDVYSLGATIYDLLTGKPPFLRGNIVLQVLEEIPASMTDRREDLDVRGKAPISQAWEKTVAACLAKDPGQRPQSAGEVLARLKADEGGAAPPPLPAVVPQPPPPATVSPVSASAARGPIAQPATANVPCAATPPVTETAGKPRRGHRLIWVLLALAVVGSLAMIPVYLHLNQKRGSAEGPGPDFPNPWLDAEDYAGTWRGRVNVTFTMQMAGSAFDGQGTLDTLITVSPAGDNVVREDSEFGWSWVTVPPGFVPSGTSPAVINGPYDVVLEGGKLVWRYDFTAGGWTKHVESTLSLSEDGHTATLESVASGTEITSGAFESNVHRALLTRDAPNAPAPLDSTWDLK